MRFDARNRAGATPQSSLPHFHMERAFTNWCRGSCAKTVLPAADKLDVPAVWELIEKWRVTNAFTVPTILKMLVEDPL